MPTPTTETPIEPHEPHWISRAAFPVLAALFFLTQASLGFAVYRANYWLAVPLVLIASHLMHGMLIGFHEASHGLLRKSRLLNEIDGIIIGIFSLMSFSLYRAAHQLHHAYLASERDEELWPFVASADAARGRACWRRCSNSRWACSSRRFFSCGPFSAAVRPFGTRNCAGASGRNSRSRRSSGPRSSRPSRCFDAWKYFLWLYLIPAWLAANMQSLRKYVEHVGLTGSTVNSSTRSIVAEGWVATFVCFTLLHEPYHGVHHWRSGLPHPELPQHAAALEPTVPEERPPFRTYRRRAA